MLTLVIALLAGFGIMLVTTRDLGPVWGMICGLLIVLVVQLLIGLLIRRKVNRVNENIQSIMAGAQAKINRKVQLFQQRPVGNPKMMQQQLEKEQFEAIRAAIAATDAAAPYYKWNLLLRKQIDTMKMMLYFQLREFDRVDALMPRCLFLDARSVATKLVRMFKLDDPGLDKFYRKKAKKFKGEDLALVASTYAYMQLKRDDAAGALQTLIDARKRTDNPVVRENWERLVNGKNKLFSNAGLGDSWYSLYLETPKIKPQRVQQRPF